MKTRDNFKLISKAGREYDMFEDFAILVEKFRISAPEYDVKSEKIDGRPGVITLEKTLLPRKLEATCSFSVGDYEDHPSLINKLVGCIGRGEEYFLISDSDPGKRWRVEVVGDWTPEKIGVYGAFTIQFTANVPLAESVNRVEYSYTSDFSFNNIGDEPIDMCIQSETEIEYIGKSSNLTIRNRQTGNEVRFDLSTNESDKILLKGIRPLLNGSNVIKKTNKVVLTFAPGWNDIEILGASDFTLTLRTRFYYI